MVPSGTTSHSGSLSSSGTAPPQDHIKIIVLLAQGQWPRLQSIGEHPLQVHFRKYVDRAHLVEISDRTTLEHDQLSVQVELWRRPHQMHHHLLLDWAQPLLALEGIGQPCGGEALLTFHDVVTPTGKNLIKSAVQIVVKRQVTGKKPTTCHPVQCRLSSPWTRG